jgi:predicted RNA-binding Zn ribbon-like protein
MSQTKTKPRFDLTGGHLCLDFANTLDQRLQEHPREVLNSYDDLVAWSEAEGALSRKQVERLRRLAQENPSDANKTLRSALQLREAIFALFRGVAEERNISSPALDLLNRSLQEAAQHGEIVHTSKQFAWDWENPEEHLDSVQWPIARAAADLLLSDELSYVRECAAEDCAWLFMDKTKNHGRRWCDMKTCGNRDKARRYYQRTKNG